MERKETTTRTSSKINAYIVLILVELIIKDLEKRTGTPGMFLFHQKEQVHFICKHGLSHVAAKISRNSHIIAAFKKKLAKRMWKTS